MKNSFILILSFIVSTTLFSQKKYLKEYYADGILKEEGWIKDGIKVGFWVSYYQNKNIKKKGHFKNDQPIKYWYFYHKNGLLENCC